jgi:pyruvate dehydrogenase (quinone)
VAGLLRAWGVDRVFGTYGREVDALVRAVRADATGGEPRFVQARNEESAALMACAHAKLTGRPGCCLAPAGAGALRLLGGLHDAALDRQPVLALVGQPPPGRRDLVSPTAFAEISVFCETVSDPALLRDALGRALRAALTDRGVATLLVPRPVLEAPAPTDKNQRDKNQPDKDQPGEDQPDKNQSDEDRAAPTRVEFSAPRAEPDLRDVRRAADLLGAGRRAAVVVGRAGVRAAGQVTGVAQLLGAGVATTPAARDALPDDLPWVTGLTGPYGSEVTAALLRECDTLLLVGAEDFDAGQVPDLARRHVVTVDDRREDGPLPARTTAVRVTGDVPAALEALLPLLRRAEDRRWRTDVENATRAWREEGRSKADRYFGTSVNPRAVVAELSDRLPDRSVVVTDSGTAVDWWGRHLRLRNGMRALLSAHLGAPGTAVPYALAARLAAPERPVIALTGDGALQAGGASELVTVRRHLERLADLPPLVFCVLNNGDLNRLTWQRRAESGDPLAPRSTEVPALDHAAFARLLGLPAVRCDRPRDVSATWEEVLASRGPVVVEFVVDGEMPPDWAEQPARSRVSISRAPLRQRLTTALEGVLDRG